MRILYGIQGTGNGHLTRARALAPALQQRGVEVDFLISGRGTTPLFDTGVFGDFRLMTGLTLITVSGQIHPLQTLRNARLPQLWRDIRALDLRRYDLVLTDFEPVTAWAARRANKPCLGIAHQYAFRHAVPQVRSFAASLLYRYFAPADVEIGCHWHHFRQPVIPPLAPVERRPDLEVDPRLVLVYLPFEDLEQVLTQLRPLTDHRFAVYHPAATPGAEGHIELNPPGRATFQEDLARCSGVVANGGFGLSSEAIQLGKPLLIKPVAGQSEQVSNGLALEALGLGQMSQEINSDTLGRWLPQRRAQSIHYPDMAELLADWIADGNIHNSAELIREAWRQTRGLPELRRDRRGRGPRPTAAW